MTHSEWFWQHGRICCLFFLLFSLSVSLNSFPKSEVENSQNTAGVNPFVLVEVGILPANRERAAIMPQCFQWNVAAIVPPGWHPLGRHPHTPPHPPSPHIIQCAALYLTKARYCFRSLWPCDRKAEDKIMKRMTRKSLVSPTVITASSAQPLLGTQSLYFFKNTTLRVDTGTRLLKKICGI